MNDNYGPVYLVVVVLVFLATWSVNMYKLTQCDFESPYRCEVIHGLGAIPLFSIGTVWASTDNK